MIFQFFLSTKCIFSKILFLLCHYGIDEGKKIMAATIQNEKSEGV